MRKIMARDITKTVAALCIQAAGSLPPDVERALNAAAEKEPWLPAKEVLDDLLRNLSAAEENEIPLCQDTGMACVFVTIGQGVHVSGNLAEAIQQGVRQGYGEGYLRKSIVSDPLRRTNTGDNTPAFISYDVVPGDIFEITIAPKGFGSENMSRIAMLNPSDGKDGVMAFILHTVKKAGPNPCPPIIVGVGIGANFDKVAALAKQALLRPLDEPNEDPYYAKMEKELLASINQTGIGPAGYGGKTTALAVSIKAAPTHIAGLPVAVNISCHATRRASARL